MRYATSIFALFAAIALSANAQAGALSLLTLDGNVDSLDDEDYESLVDTDKSGTFSQGDLFVGIFTLSAINGNPTVGVGSLSGVLVAAIDNITGTAVTFRAATVAEYAGLISGANPGLGGPIGGFALSNLPARTNANSALLVYDDTSYGANGFIEKGTFTGAGAPPQYNQYIGVNSTLLPFNNGTNGPKILEFGFVGDASASGVLGPGTGQTNVLNFTIGLNVTANTTPIAFLDVSEVSGLNPTQIQIDGKIDAKRPSAVTGAYQFRTGSTMFVNAVPEPGSMTLFGLGALGLLGARMRRRNAA